MNLITDYGITNTSRGCSLRNRATFSQAVRGLSATAGLLPG